MELLSRHPRSGGPAVDLLIEQRRLVRWQIAKERSSAFLRVLAGIGGCGLAAALVWLALDSSNHRGLTVKPFSVPPDLAQRGLTGPAVASLMLDRLTVLQEATDTARPATSFQQDWSRDDLKVEIPSTGISLVDLRRLLIGWLGHETEVSGEVYRGQTGLNLAVRAGGSPAGAVTERDQDLEQLFDRAAESIYAKTQPYRYTVYLARRGRQAEAATILEQLARSTDPVERAWAHNALGGHARGLGNDPAALNHFAAALRDGPFGPAQSSTARMLYALGWDEQSLAWSRAYIAWEQRHADTAPAARAANLNDHRAAVAVALRDYNKALSLARAGQQLPEYAGSGRAAVAQSAQALIGLHQYAAAARELSMLDASAEPVLELTRDQALGVGDRPRALAAVAALQASASTNAGQSNRTRLVAGNAEALAEAGDIKGAAALIGPTATTCHPCLIARARIASLSGDPAAADRWFAEAQRQAPSLPITSEAWGEAKLARGDLQGALTLLRKAQGLGPSWANPVKLEADALLLAGDARSADKRYAVAAGLAHRWGSAQLAWADALSALGRTKDARSKRQAALALDLTPAEAARTRQLLAGSMP